MNEVAYLYLVKTNLGGCWSSLWLMKDHHEWPRPFVIDDMSMYVLGNTRHGGNYWMPCPRGLDASCFTCLLDRFTKVAL